MMLCKPAQAADTATQRSLLRKWQIATIVVLYFAYIGVLMNRRGIAVVLPSMRNDTRIDFTTQDVGPLLASGNAAHLIMELISGPITDRIGGRISFLVCSMIPAVSTLLFAFARSLPLWIVLLVISRAAQAAVYPALTKLISTWFNSNEYGRAWGILSSSSRVGAASAGLVIGSLIKAGFTWDQALYFCAGVLALGNAVSWFVIKKDPETVGLSLEVLNVDVTAHPSTHDEVGLLSDTDIHAEVTPDSEPPKEQKEEPKQPVVLKAAEPPRRPLLVVLKGFVTEPRFWLISFSTSFTWLLFEFDLYVPLYLQDYVGLSPSEASLAAAAFPSGMAVSMVVGGIILDKLGRKRGNIAIFVSLIAVVMCVFALWIATLTGNVTTGFVLTVAVLYGMFLGMPAYLPQSIFSMRFGGKQDCATCIAVIDLFGWLAIITFDIAAANLITPERGWNPVFIMLCVSGVLSLVFMGAFLLLDYKAFLAEEALKALIHDTEGHELRIVSLADRVDEERRISISLRRRSLEV